MKIPFGPCDTHPDGSKTQDPDGAKRISDLTHQLEQLQRENMRLRQDMDQHNNGNGVRGEYVLDASTKPMIRDKLSKEHIERYSRQLLLRGGFGVKGQMKLLSSSVLVVGAGGIGSTVIPYLAACGIGRLAVVDYDEVDVSNLHRQVIHNTQDVGLNKAESAARAVHDLNPTIFCQTFKEPLTSRNALELISQHDCIVDASDNPQTRYLINDACILAGKPLVSGSAIGIEGQLTVYNYNGGPCYRCLYPKPNVTEGSKSCSDHGVLGPVPGLIGVLQAAETIKVLTGVGDVMSDRLVMYDALQCSFLRIKKPPKQVKCPACGPDATIRSMHHSEEASQTARGPSCAAESSTSPSVLPESQQISVEDYAKLRRSGQLHILLDVRVPEQFDLCALDDAVNVPLQDIQSQIDRIEELADGKKPILCLCRRGIASSSATQLLNQLIDKHPKILSVTNIKGGLDAWRKKVDRTFPKY